MTARSLIGFLFILYCVEAGTFLLMVPWTPHWDRLVIALPSAELQVAALWSWVRGAVTGVGFLHLLWGIHDLDASLLRRQRRKPAD